MKFSIYETFIWKWSHEENEETELLTEHSMACHLDSKITFSKKKKKLFSTLRCVIDGYKPFFLALGESKFYADYP